MMLDEYMFLKKNKDKYPDLWELLNVYHDIGASGSQIRIAIDYGKRFDNLSEDVYGKISEQLNSQYYENVKLGEYIKKKVKEIRQ